MTILLCHLPWTIDGQICIMLHCRGDVKSHMECILGTDCRLFQSNSIRYPIHNKDHYLILGCLHITTLKEHQCFLGRVCGSCSYQPCDCHGRTPNLLPSIGRCLRPQCVSNVTSPRYPKRPGWSLTPESPSNRTQTGTRGAFATCAAR